MSDGFQEALGESMTAFKFGGLVLKEKQKAALYAVTLKKQDAYIIDQAGGQDGWILAKFSFCLASPGHRPERFFGSVFFLHFYGPRLRLGP